MKIKENLTQMESGGQKEEVDHTTYFRENFQLQTRIDLPTGK